MDSLVSKPDHGEQIIEKFNDELVASQRLQVFFDDIAAKINELGGGSTGTITPSTFTPSSIIYRPSSGTDILPATINPNEFLGRGPVGEIQGLDFSEAWGILGNGTTNIIINNTGGANLFTVESNNSPTMFRVDGSNERVGIARNGLIPNDGLLHVLDSQASGGIVTASPDGNDLVLEHDLFGGMSILNGSNTIGSIFFGSPAYGNESGQIWFLHDTDFNLPRLGFDVRGKTYQTMYDTIGTFFNEFQDADIDFQINTFAEAPFMQVHYDSVAGVGRMGLSQGVSFAPTQGILHIFDGGSSSFSGTVSTSAQNIVLESNALAGMTFLSGPGQFSSIVFGDEFGGSPRNFAMGIFAKPNADTLGAGRFEFRVDDGLVARMYITAAATTINPRAGFFTCDFSVLGFPNSANLLYVDTTQLTKRVSMSDIAQLGTDGLLHLIQGGLAGVVTANTGANTLVLESNTNAGISLLSGNANQGAVVFGDDGANNQCVMQYDHLIDTWELTMRAGAAIPMQVTPSEIVFNQLGNTDLDLRVEAANTDGFFFINATGGGQAGFTNLNGVRPNQGLVHIIQTGEVAAVVAPGASCLVLEDSTGAGLSIFSDVANTGTIAWGDQTNGPTDGVIEYVHASRRFNFDVGGVSTVLTLTNDALTSRAHTVSLVPNTAGDFELNIGTAGTAENSDLNFHTSAGFVSYNAQIRGSGATATIGAGFLDVHAARLGISSAGIAGTDGMVHLIQTALAGVIAASANANTLVLESTGEMGLSFLVDNATGVANIAFGDPSNGATAGLIQFTASLAKYAFFNTAREALSLYPTELVFNEGGLNNMTTRFESVGSVNMLRIDPLNNRVGIADNGFAPSDGLFHLFQGGAAGLVTAHASADGIVLESNGVTGFSILVPNDGTAGNIYIGAPTTGNNSGQISYVPFTGLMTLATSALPAIRMDTNQNILLGTIGAAATSAAGALHIPNDTSPTAVLANAVVIGSKDSGAGGNLAVPEIWIEEPPEAVGTFTPTMKMKIWVNGTEYFMQLDPV